MKRLISLLLTGLFTAAVLILPACADTVTDNISIYVGYFGGPHYEKATYHWTELDDMFGGALDTYETTYSYYSGSRSARDSARGFLLSDLLYYAGVDFNSISSLDFYTQDQTTGAYRSFTKYALLDAPRYYFPNVAADENGVLYAIDGGDMWDMAVRVETMLALEDCWEWDAVGENFSSPSTSARFRLLFGQATPDEAMTSSAAKYVYAVYITFSGTPIITADEPNVELKVGSQYQITVNVSAEDTLLDEYVKENLLWSSNNTQVVDVDNYGNITVNGDGQAVVTASFGETSVSVNLNVAADEPEVKEGGGGGEETGGSALTASEAPAQPVTEEKAPTPSETKPESEPEPLPEASLEPQPAEIIAPPESEVTEVAISENDKGVYILSKELMQSEKFSQWVNSIITPEVDNPDDSGGVANWRENKMDDDSQALTINYDDEGHTLTLCLCLGACLFGGLVFGLIKFKIAKGRLQ